jgi:hypothetical protein
MKLMGERTYTDQALANSKGVSWMDDCRIPYGAGTERAEPQWKQKSGVIWTPEKEWKQDIERQANEKGRFPANLLVSDDVLLRGKESQRQGQVKGVNGYSRFFSLDAWAEKNLPFLIEPKASTAEKEEGLESLEEKRIEGRDPGQDERNNAFKIRPKKRKNIHPTVKPLRLMAYLITMFSRPGDIILDPFCGSGTTCIAADMLERRFIGIEMNAEYREIALKRLEYVKSKKVA